MGYIDGIHVTIYTIHGSYMGYDMFPYGFILSPNKNRNSPKMLELLRCSVWQVDEQFNSLSFAMFSGRYIVRWGAKPTNTTGGHGLVG